MTIPPKTLWSRLINCESITLKSAANIFLGSITGAEARALALHGLVEGYARKIDGPVRYVRHLAATAQQPEHDIQYGYQAEEIYKSSSGAFAQTNMGVVREYLNEAIVGVDRADRRVVVAEGQQQGWCYALSPQPPSNWEAQMSVIQARF